MLWDLKKNECMNNTIIMHCKKLVQKCKMKVGQGKDVDVFLERINTYFRTIFVFYLAFLIGEKGKSFLGATNSNNFFLTSE